VCIFAGRLTDKRAAHASRKASFVLPAPMDASMFLCLQSLQSGAWRSPPFSLQTAHFLLYSLLPNLTGSSKQSSTKQIKARLEFSWLLTNFYKNKDTLNKKGCVFKQI
jgi:hypothetical protein